MRETRSSLMMTWLFCTSVLDSNRNLRSPCSRIFSDIQSNCPSSHKLPGGLVRGPDFIPPLRFKFVKLISGIAPSILNRFPRFQWRCVLLENIFPTTYNMTQYVQGIPREKKGKQKNGKFRFLSPRVDIGTEITPLESYELTGFLRICTTTFGALLKFHDFILPLARLVS